MISSYQRRHVSNIFVWFRTFRFWLRWETWAGGYLRGLLSTPVRKFKVEIWRSLTDSYFCTNLQQLSNCWPAITLRIQVTVMLLTERYTLIRNFTMMTSVTLESINQCIFTRPVACLYTFTPMILRSLKSNSSPNNYVLFVLIFIFVDGSC